MQIRYYKITKDNGSSVVVPSCVPVNPMIAATFYGFENVSDIAEIPENIIKTAYDLEEINKIPAYGIIKSYKLSDINMNFCPNDTYIAKASSNLLLCIHHTAYLFGETKPFILLEYGIGNKWSRFHHPKPDNMSEEDYYEYEKEALTDAVIAIQKTSFLYGCSVIFDFNIGTKKPEKITYENPIILCVPDERKDELDAIEEAFISTVNNAFTERMDYYLRHNDKYVKRCPNCGNNSFETQAYTASIVTSTDEKLELHINNEKVIFVKDADWECCRCNKKFKESDLIISKTEADKNMSRLYLVQKTENPDSYLICKGTELLSTSEASDIETVSKIVAHFGYTIKTDENYNLYLEHTGFDVEFALHSNNDDGLYVLNYCNVKDYRDLPFTSITRTLFEINKLEPNLGYTLIVTVKTSKDNRLVKKVRFHTGCIDGEITLSSGLEIS